ncbi:MAG TPA: hypothetical protein VG328_05075 [Stellaceae bacterium]|jgi:hypothetical protein|nr:hypothetical protein [Stellaceae bacterium]
MPGILARLKAAHCRVDGLLIAPDGAPDFAATNASGDWSTAEKEAVQAALGLATPTIEPAQRVAAGAAAIERWLDRTAQALGYNNFVTAVSYASSSVDLWRRQALALTAWRDAVWQAAIALLAEPAQLPVDAPALIASLPQPNIPTS